MRFLRSLHRQVRELPSLHQVMFWFACGAVVWQSVYLIDFTVLYLDRAWGIGVGLGHGNQPWSLLMLLDPVLFLTLCSAFYVGSIVVIGRAYVLRKEAALVVALEEVEAAVALVAALIHQQHRHPRHLVQLRVHHPHHLLARVNLHRLHHHLVQ